MPTRPRTRSSDQDALDLLEHLIETPPSAAGGWSAPVALRSREEQRRYALRRYRLRTWVDYALAHAERLLALAALLVFGYWFLDGPARDWLHERQRPAAVSEAAAWPGATIAPPATAERAEAEGAPAPAGAAGGLAASIPLPYITDEMADAEARSAPRPTRAAPQAAVVSPKADPAPRRLVIPAIGLDTPVYEVFIRDGVWEVAEYAAGYLNGSALPGEAGNTALAGHAGLRGAVFRDLGALAPGNEVFVEAGGRRYRYVVRETMAVWPTQVEVLDPTETPVLTMITCTNWDTQRLVVIADLADSQPIS